VEVNESGVVVFYAPDRKSLEQARERILELAGSLNVGEIYEGTVVSVKDFGAFVRVRGQDGLVHVSEWASTRVDNMTEHAKEGDKVRIKVLPPDRQGRLALSRKEAL
ncbi:MAG: S1 RNA-binding domain-containing protein, partial [Deltaproteobacteria bacterium]|nr:S1 RNA-binding domain-containing protein [Deltaproteobacteria bacterium]